MFGFRNRNDDLAATLGGLSTTGGIRGANLMGEIDTDAFNGIGTKGLSAKKKAYLERIELREAKKKAIEIDK
jgi:hypothetical protein